MARGTGKATDLNNNGFQFDPSTWTRKNYKDGTLHSYESSQHEYYLLLIHGRRYVIAKKGMFQKGPRGRTRSFDTALAAQIAADKLARGA